MPIRRRRGWFLALGLLLTLPLWAQEPTSKKDLTPPALEEGEEYLVYRIPIQEGMLSESMPFFTHRAIEAGKAAGADAFIVDLDTPGGALNVYQELRDELIDVDLPVYAYVNPRALSAGALLAVAADRIVMAPTGNIGASQVITGTGQALGEVVEQKINAALKAEIRATARYKGHPVRICEAFIDREIEIPGLTPQGEVLAMDAYEATNFVDEDDPTSPASPHPLAAFVAEDIEDLLKQDGFWPATVRNYELSWSERFARFLFDYKSFLLLIGLGALFIEVKTPGLGVPGAIGVLALALFFWAGHVADLASVIDVVLFVVGVSLLLVEIFVIPGFGLPGAAGIVCIVGGVLFAMVDMQRPALPDMRINYAQLKEAVWALIWTFLMLIPVVYFSVKHLPSAPFFRLLFLAPYERPAAAGGSAGGAVAETSFVGQVGTALTDLRPSGTARVGGRRLDVMTRGEYVPQGAKVRVVEEHGVVRLVEKA